MKAQAFNPQIFVEFLCYLVFGGLMLYLVSSGQYLSYVTPRMEPYLYFTATVMGIWAFVGLGRLFRPQHKVRAAHCFVLAIPILLLLLPHSPLNTADLSGNYIGGNTFASQSGQSSYDMPQEQVTLGGSGLNATTSIPTEYPSGLDTTDNSYAATPLEDGLSDSATTVPDTQIAIPENENSDLDVANKRITVSNEDFGTWLTALYEDMRAYEGYTVVMTGFVFKDSELFKDDIFRLYFSLKQMRINTWYHSKQEAKATQASPIQA